MPPRGPDRFVTNIRQSMNQIAAGNTRVNNSNASEINPAHLAQISRRSHAKSCGIRHVAREEVPAKAIAQVK